MFHISTGAVPAVPEEALWCKGNDGPKAEGLKLPFSHRSRRVTPVRYRDGTAAACCG